MSKKIFIIGAGGFAREVLSIYIDSERENDVLGFLTEHCKKNGDVLNGKPVHHISYLDRFGMDERPLLIGAIGSTTVRERLLTLLENDGFCFDTIIHPTTIRSKWIKIGRGSIVAAGTIMTCQIEIENHVIINLGVRIGHDVKIGNFVTISPSAEIMGGVTLRDNVFVGTNATIIEGITVGKGAVIAAGAVVTKDIPDRALAAGVPAEIKKIYTLLEEKPW
jgi:sugar O-acyltransferase (sialic acid O-acetyltransferase NeuD family)